MFHTSVSEYLLFKGGTSLSKGWDLIQRFSEDIDLALSRDYFLNIKNLSCANCASNTQIHKLREVGQDFLLGEFKIELDNKLKELGLDVNVFGENEVLDENGEPSKVPHDKELPSSIQIVPSETLMPVYEDDYNSMKKSFIYGDSLSFSELIGRLQAIQERFHSLV